MNTLVIVGAYLQTNSSAVLCHRAYITGLIKLGHSVDLLTLSGHSNKYVFPPLLVNHQFNYQGSQYERVAYAKNRQIKGSAPISNLVSKASHSSKKKAISRKLIAIIKKAIRKGYGVYGLEKAWYRQAKAFCSSTKYDYVISLSYPPVSHRLAEYLISKKHIVAEKWIQIWEDPWYSDLYGHYHTEKVQKEEKRITSKANLVYYVSPLTLKYQKQQNPSASARFRWQPLPAYYSALPFNGSWDTLSFGYFGDYVTTVRDLEPFYSVANDLNLSVTVCGNSDKPLFNTETIHVFPRLPLDKLSVYESQTNVLVYLCNRSGGQIPGKIYQYSATDRLILFILDGTEEEKKTLYDYFRQFNRYIFCDNTVESIKKAVQFLQKKQYKESHHTPLYDFEPPNIINHILKGE